MWEILQTGTDSFEVRCGGVIVETVATYDLAVASLAAHAQAALAALGAAGVTPAGDGLLPDTWTSTAGIAFSEDTGDGRDFTQCVWTSRDPAQSLLPLMLQTTTEVGHFGAVWCGFLDSIAPGKTSTATGRFYDNAEGIRARDMMLGGRIVGVSVDPGAVDVQFTCTEEDDFGFCIDGIMSFLAYEIIGLTITPFPAFAKAAISLSDTAVAASAATDTDSTVTASGRWLNLLESVPLVASAPIEIPEVVPMTWLYRNEPELGDPLLVRQPPRFDGDETDHWAVPLTILDSGEVFGHVAPEGQCHIGYPNECVTAPTSRTDYAYFHVGTTDTDNGLVPTGTLIARCDHAPLSMSASQARNHYDNTSLAWADVRAIDGTFGVWVCGVLRPDITPAALRVLRASGLSGDWRDIGGGLEMVTAQCVNVPGFPIAREAMAASGLDLPTITGPSFRRTNGRLTALTAAGVVRRPCPDCEAQRTLRAAQRGDQRVPQGMLIAMADIVDMLRRHEAILARLDQRTAPLRQAAVRDLVASIRGSDGVVGD